eukprot:4609245-Alexandrium_andersonii.AAC.1
MPGGIAPTEARREHVHGSGAHTNPTQHMNSELSAGTLWELVLVNRMSPTAYDCLPKRCGFPDLRGPGMLGFRQGLRSMHKQ